MNLFDNLKCECLPPVTVEVETTPIQDMDNYQIRKDGTLWHEVGGKWVQVVFTGAARFYTNIRGAFQNLGWTQWSSHFVDGQLKEIYPVNMRI